ncbi:hypothetical protein [Tenacibaculum agarivorans]|uniref:hypothetical protein n=1 Tax=Tenacibaculum agarivorans TaxID=1908389 RepID=UPI00094BA69F|nr:hypothetical protein [Tenacibaculum agarivorans]
MNTNFLLPNKYKFLGWTLLTFGILIGFYVIASDYESDLLEIKVLSIFSDPLIGGNKGFFKLIENSIVDEIACLLIIIGGLTVGFSKEKIEDEFIAKLRTDSLIWALVINYLILALTIVFVYDLTFFNILVFNMFTPLLFFIVRFNFLKIRA